MSYLLSSLPQRCCHFILGSATRVPWDVATLNPNLNPYYSSLTLTITSNRTLTILHFKFNGVTSELGEESRLHGPFLILLTRVNLNAHACVLNIRSRFKFWIVAFASLPVRCIYSLWNIIYIFYTIYFSLITCICIWIAIDLFTLLSTIFMVLIVID